jgi:hypothetical protein
LLVGVGEDAAPSVSTFGKVRRIASSRAHPRSRALNARRTVR